MAAKRTGSPLQQIGLGARLIGASVLAGGLVAGIALPAVGVVGLSAKSASDDFSKNIPSDFTQPPLSQASTVYDADGGVVAKVYSRDRTVVPLSQIAPIMRQALVDIEDNRFYEHGAIDLKGTLRALLHNSNGGSTQGASTLTQQYVKNVFVEEAGDDQAKVLEAQRQTMGRKIQELKYAIYVEEHLSKDQILANYLNITFFGEKAYGIEAAAERYFSVHASQLTLPQAAMLAGLVQSPTSYDPVIAPDKAKTRRDEVLDKMAEYGTITAAQAAAAKAKPLGLKVKPALEGCITASKYGEQFFCDYVQHVIETNPVFGRTATDRAAVWNRGGLQIHTTLDPKAQKALYKSVTKHVYSSDRAATAMTMVEPGTGKILAMGQSRKYGIGASNDQTTLNYNVDRLMGGGNGFPTGSTFKAVTAAAALEQGIPMSKVYPSPYKDNYPAMTDCNGNRLAETPGDQNDSPSLVGPFAMPKAMAQSVNTYFVPLEADTGLCNVVKMAQKLGLGSQAMVGKDGQLTPIGQYQSLTLGVNSLTPLQMANAYATFAARGLYCTPTAITSITTADHKRLSVPQGDCQQVMSTTTADSVSSMLKGVVDDGTGKQAGALNQTSAGKTGTTNDHLQVWFVGFTKQIAAATVVSDTRAPLKSLSFRTIGGNWVSDAFGSTLAGPIWNDAMRGALSGEPDLGLSTVPLPAEPSKKDNGNKNKGQTQGQTQGQTAGALAGLTGLVGISGGNNGNGNGNGGHR